MRRNGWLFVAGVLLLALNLRPAVTVVPPILDEIGHRLGYSSVVLTLLTTIPVVCFAVFSPVAGWLARRWGDERGLQAAMVAVALGQVARAADPAALMLPGTIVACAGIAVMNVLLSSLVKRRAPGNADLLLGAYLAMLYLGAMAGSALSVPLYHSDSGSIGLPLWVWAVPALLGVLAWSPQSGSRTAPDLPPLTGWGRLRRNRLAWAVTAFMGLQSLVFYATLSILPDLYRSRGLSASAAGLVDTMLSVGGLITSMSTPVLVARYRWGRPLVLASAAACLAGTVGALVTPLAVALPLGFFLGLGQGATLALALYFIMARAATPEVAGGLSEMAQGIGYAIAVAGPLVAGLLHSATHRWGASVAFLALVSVSMLWFGLASSHPHSIDSEGTTVKR